MKKLLFLLLLLPFLAHAQTPVTPQFKVKIPRDSLLSFSIPGVTGNEALPDTNWFRKHVAGVTIVPSSIVSGLTLSVSGSTLSVSAGQWRISNILYHTTSTTTFTLLARDSTMSRYETVYADSANTIHIAVGLLSFTPIEPVIPHGDLRVGAALITPTNTIVVGGLPSTSFIQANPLSKQTANSWYHLSKLDTLQIGNYYMPAFDGTSNEVIVTNGMGQLSFSSIAIYTNGFGLNLSSNIFSVDTSKISTIKGLIDTLHAHSAAFDTSQFVIQSDTVKLKAGAFTIHANNGITDSLGYIQSGGSIIHDTEIDIGLNTFGYSYQNGGGNRAWVTMGFGSGMHFQNSSGVDFSLNAPSSTTAIEVSTGTVDLHDHAIFRGETEINNDESLGAYLKWEDANITPSGFWTTQLASPGVLQFQSISYASNGQINLAPSNNGDIIDGAGKYFIKALGNNMQVILGDGTLGTYGGGGGTTTHALTLGFGLVNATFDGSVAVTAKADSNVLQTILNYFPKGDTRWLKSATAASTYEPIITGSKVLPNGVTATTQTTGDNTAKVATDDFVNASISAISAGVPTSRTITINGNTQDLSANRTYTITTANTDTASTGFATQKSLIPYQTKAQNIATYQTLANLETTVTNNSTLYPSGSAVTTALAAKVNVSDTSAFAYVHINKAEIVLGPKTFNKLITQSLTGIGTTPTVSFMATDIDVATSGNQKISGGYYTHSSGFKTTGSAAVDVYNGMYVLPVQGAANPTALWHLGFGIGTTTLTDAMTVDAAGNTNIGNGALTAFGSSTLTTITSSAITLNGKFNSSGSNVYFNGFNGSENNSNSVYQIGTAGVTSFKGGWTAAGGATMSTAAENGFNWIFGSGNAITTASSGATNIIANLAIKPVSLTIAGTASVANSASIYGVNASSGATNNYDAYFVGLNRSDTTEMKQWKLGGSFGGPNQVAAINSSGALAWAATSITQATSDLTAQTTAANVTTFTVGSSTATFNVSGYINITAVTVDVIEMQVTYTDENSTSQTANFFTQGATSALLSAIGNSVYPPMTIRAKNGTTITVKTTLTTGTGSITFDAGSRITQL